jgi:parallel beta-helix repeat protein
MSRISGNRFHDDRHGVWLHGGSDDVIAGNVIKRLGASAIDVDSGAERVRVVHNTIADAGDGITSTESSNNLFRGNTVLRAGFLGTPETGGFGMVLDGSDHETVVANHFLDGRGPAVIIGKLDAAQPSRDAVLIRNVVSSRLTDGILVDSGAAGTLLKGNIAIHSGHDGINVQAVPTSLQGNLAAHNRALGIEAIAGALDLGGNRAFGNGDPAQCTGVLCEP